MVITVFRARARPNLSADTLGEVEARGARMYTLARGMPGFISYKDFTADDGEVVTIVEFDTQEHTRAWGEHPEHKLVQEWGRQVVFSEYQIQVCELVRGTRFADGVRRVLE
jgi:heme-degrading monooxygenase HmoA